jgi:hypothetical protein
MLRFNLAKGGYSMRVRPSGIQWMKKEKLLLILLLALIIAASSPVQGESWKDAAKKAAVDYGSKKTTEFVSEKLEGQLQELLKDLKWWPGMKGGKNPYYMALNATATNSAKLKEIADGLASDDPAEVNKAQEELALGFGKAVSSVAGKSVGKQALNTLIGNKKDVAEIASVLGSAAVGDTQAGMEFIGSKIIDMTPIGEVVDFYKTAYGVMKYGVDKFETAQLEELYQKYRTGKISEEELKSDLGNPPYLSLVVHSHNIELRNQREEMLKSFKGTIDDQLYRHLTEVNDEQTIGDVVSVMKERKNKEDIDKVKAETKAESESQAKEILSALEDELKAKYGSDWEIKGSSYNLDKFIERTIELYDANKGLISLQQAASIMAKKLVYGQNSLEYNKLASTNLPLARVSFSKDAVINRSKIIAGQGAIVTPGFSVSRGFGFKEGPVDTPCQPSINGVIGEVPAPGSLNASIDSGSKVPGTWSLYNANTGLHIYFEPKYGKAYGPADDILSLGENSGSGDESKPYHVEGSANWPSPGRLTYVIAAPGGAGPLTGSCFKQSGSIKIKITSLKRETPAKNFDVLRDGDRLQTGSSEAIIRMPNGSELQVRPHSILSFTTTDKGTTRVEVKQGGFRISQPPGMKHDQEMKLGSKIIDPNRTEYFGQWDGSKGSLAVVEGNISVSDQNGTETALEAGQQMELPGGNISPYNLSTDDGGLAFGLPMRDLPVDDSLPEPSGYYEAAFSNGKIPKDWIWQDPGNDARIETPGNGTLRMTVPDGNDIWYLLNTR